MSTCVPPHNVASGDVQPNGLLLTKYQRGRLKKLKKRASTNNTIQADESGDVERKRKKHSSTSASTSSLSGLKSWEDVKELECLLQLERKEKSNVPPCDDPSNTFSFGPSFHLLKSSPHKLMQKCTGTDHRDLILSLLFHDGSKLSKKQIKKQKRKLLKEDTGKCVDDCAAKTVVHGSNATFDIGQRSSARNDYEQLQAWVSSRVPPLPSWVRIHNPAYATHLAVVEFSFDFVDSTRVFRNVRNDDLTDEESSLALFISSNPVCKALRSSSGLHGRQALWLRTKLFEGDNPKRASVVLGNVDRERFSSPLTQPFSEDRRSYSNKKNSCAFQDAESHDELYYRLQELMLSPQQLILEGYPMVPPKFLDFVTTELANHNLILELNKISETLQNLVNADTVTAPDVPIIHSTDALPFSREYAIELITMLESNMLNDAAPSSVSKPSYVSTFLARKENLGPIIFAIDCEMVKTTFGLELARVTLLRLDQKKSNETSNCHYTTVLDMLVKPQNRIIDFLTEYSGISPQSLNDVLTSIQEVQLALLGLISKEDIIVGHSLENDLHALRLSHVCVVDTAVLFRSGGRKHALRHLSSALLRRTIQDATFGHCSIEDAGATLELAFRRAKYGSSFKLQSKARHEIHLMELIDTVRKRHDGDQGFAVTREKGGLVCIGSNSWLKSCVNARSSAHTLICEDISCSTRNSVCAWIKSDLRKPNFLLASICVKESNHISFLDQFLNEVVQAAPPTTMVLIIFQNGFEKAHALTEQRKAMKNPKATLRWESEMEVQWRSAIEECRNCEAFWIGLR